MRPSASPFHYSRRRRAAATTALTPSFCSHFQLLISISLLMSNTSTFSVADEMTAGVSSSSSSLSSNRASAKQRVADSWANRRKSSTAASPNVNNIKNPTAASETTTRTSDSIPVCQVVRNAWEQLTNNVSQRLQIRPSPKTTTRPQSSSSTQPRVFPSVISVLQASAVSNQVVGILQQEEEMNVLPSDYDWQQAIQSSTLERERAFLLLDLSAVVKAFVKLHQVFGNSVKLHYRVQHNRDAKLLELCCRLGIALRTNSSVDVEAAVAAVEKQQHSTRSNSNLIVDDASATRKPDGYLRRFRKASPESGSSLAVDGPDEVQRIHDTYHRLSSRRQQQQQDSNHDDTPNKRVLSFILRLTRDCNDWNALVQATMQACCETQTRLVGVSVDLVKTDKDYLQEIQTSLSSIAKMFFQEDSTMKVDVTGTITQELQPFLADLTQSYDDISVDASTLLVEHAGALCTRIIGVKEVGDLRHLYIDDGCYGSLYRDWAREDQEYDYTPLPLLHTKSTSTQTTTVWGPTCDGLDRVCQNVVLPQMQVDEWLVFPDMGLASGMGTAFNGFDPPDVAYCVLGYFRHL